MQKKETPLLRRLKPAGAKINQITAVTPITQLPAATIVAGDVISELAFNFWCR
jgi:hypothetical protein